MRNFHLLTAKSLYYFTIFLKIYLFLLVLSGFICMGYYARCWLSLLPITPSLYLTREKSKQFLYSGVGGGSLVACRTFGCFVVMVASL